MDLHVDPVEGRLGIAVSGGADSMALLHAYLAVGQDLVVLNVEHGIRGESSRRDTAFVASYCEKHGVPFLSRSVDVPSSLLPGESVELCARRLRYAFFEEVLAAGTADRIALAHHADDNAETILMRVFRGTGLRGLTGITDRDGYLHPLLSRTKREILEYVREHSVPFVEDETNACPDYTRNFLRNEILPAVRTRYPDVTDALVRLAASAAEADEYLSSIAPVAETPDGDLHLNDLFGYPVVLQKYAVFAAVRRLGILRDFEYRHAESVLALRDKPTNTTVDLPFSLRAAKYGNGVILWVRDDEVFSPSPFRAESAYSFRGRTYRFLPAEGVINGITFDLDAIPPDTVIRTREDGDVFKRVNGRRKLLGDYLNDRKLTAAQKERLLVAASGKEVLLVLGLETSDLVKITPETTKIRHVIKE